MPIVVFNENVTFSHRIHRCVEAGFKTYVNGQVQQVKRAGVGLIITSFYGQLSRRQHRH